MAFGVRGNKRPSFCPEPRVSRGSGERRVKAQRFIKVKEGAICILERLEGKCRNDMAWMKP